MELVAWISELIEADELWRFYKSKEFRKLKEEVLREQHHECQMCKENGKITPADTVHHIQYVRNHPGLALSKTYNYAGKEHRNLIAVCRSCHNKIHREKGCIRKQVKVVTGLPGCGKTTYVQKHRLPEEPVFDLDYIVDAMAIGGQADRDTMVAVGNGLLHTFVSRCKEVHASAWVIRTAPSESDMKIFREANAVYIDLPYDLEKCMRSRPLITAEEMKEIQIKYEIYKKMKKESEEGGEKERW